MKTLSFKWDDDDNFEDTRPGSITTNMSFAPRDIALLGEVVRKLMWFIELTHEEKEIK